MAEKSGVTINPECWQSYRCLASKGYSSMVTDDISPSASMSWSMWCRLCGGEDDVSRPLLQMTEPTETAKRVAKYLSIAIQSQLEVGIPINICQHCHEILCKFDSYAIQCERVQCMFQSLLKGKETFQKIEDSRLFRKNFLQFITDDVDKFVPICTIKAEDEDPIGNVEKQPLKLIDSSDNEWPDDNTGEFIVKNETDGETYDGIEDSCSEDDSLPLSAISGLQLDRKRKSSKKLKHSPKAKRKKSKSKNINFLEEIIPNPMVDIKAEPLSCDENVENIDLLKENLELKKSVKKAKKKFAKSIISFDCYICKENCKNWHALCLHFRDIHNSRAKVLCCCGKYLASRVSIGRHCASHGKIDSFDCTKCDKRFPRETELQSHMITHLPKEEHPFVCCKCARRFTTQQLLRHHERKHIPMEERLTHLCKFCKSKFASKSSLLMHIKSVHERLKPFVCDQCGRAFTTKGILEEHQVRHSDERPHVCNVCHKTFKTKQRLSIHSDTHNDTVYQCPHCPMQLNSRRTLRMHLFVHDDFLRYQCTLCGKGFRRAKDLKNHSNLHTGKRPYSCPWCSRTFANGSNCRAHKRRMHPNELRIYDAGEAMRNKIIVSPSEDAPVDENKDVDSATISYEPKVHYAPKVIYANLKRKVPESSTNPIITFPPNTNDKIGETLDLSENKGPLPLTKKPDVEVMLPRVNDPSPPKQEKSSPLHNYESSLSPLNLNASSVANKRRIESLTHRAEESIEFHDHDEEDYDNVPITLIPNLNNASVYSETAYKNVHDFNKQPQTFFNEQSVYNNAPPVPSSFSGTHPYSIHYGRGSQN